jgi:Terminase RNaseH-like domain
VSRLCVQCTWDEVPHLTQAAKDQLLDDMSPHLREARSKGIPMLGAGVIYPVPESIVLCDPFEIPEYWPKAYGMDVGWNRTAVVWGAWDRSSDIVYVYSEHYMGQAAPSVHASAIKARGAWIPGAIDPASAGASQIDGKALRIEYQKEGLDLVDANNAVEAGIHACYQRLVSGRLKVFRTCRNWTSEFRIYRRDKKGKIVKENDHLMDATKYLIMTGMGVARTAPMFDDDEELSIRRERNATTGY